MFQVAVFCLGVGGALVAMLVNSHQPDPYMVGESRAMKLNLLIGRVSYALHSLVIMYAG